MHKHVRVILFFRVLEKFASDAIFEDKWHENPRPSRTISTDENILKIESYFEKNPNASIRRAAQIIDIHREWLRNILRYCLDFHP